MKKFEVRTEHAEIKVNPDKSLSAEDILNAVYSLMDRDPQTIGSFDTLEEAEALFEEAKDKCDTHLYHYVTYFLGVDIVFIMLRKQKQKENERLNLEIKKISPAATEEISAET